MQTVEYATDQVLQETIHREIERDPEVFTRDIHVAVEDGVVTLTGFAHSYFEKLAAEEDAKRTVGVRGIANDIDVRLGTERTDPEIAREAVRALRLDPSVPQNEIKVTVRNGHVTIHGTVDHYSQKRCAEQVVTGVSGLKGVTNRIEIRPAASAGELESRVAEALRAQGATHVSIVAVKGAVTLRGRVRSGAEKNEVERAAWATPGVCFVENLIAVEH
jgi:osmotically-inducible protein OsmY